MTNTLYINMTTLHKIKWSWC